MYIEGNNGGDYLLLEKRKNGLVYIEVGHCCVIDIRAEIPIEILTATLGKALRGDSKNWELPWSEEFNKSLKEKVRKIGWGER